MRKILLSLFIVFAFAVIGCGSSSGDSTSIMSSTDNPANEQDPVDNDPGDQGSGGETPEDKEPGNQDDPEAEKKLAVGKYVLKGNSNTHVVIDSDYMVTYTVWFLSEVRTYEDFVKENSVVITENGFTVSQYGITLEFILVNN